MTVEKAGSSSVPPQRELPVVWSQHVDDYVSALTVSHDGSLVAIGTGSGRICAFETATGRLRFKCDAHPGGVLATAFSPRAQLLATSGQDGYARIFDAKGEVRAEVSGGAAWVEHLAWAPSGAYLATTSGRTARVWVPDGGPVFEAEPASSTLTGVAWNSQGTQVATSCSGGVSIIAGHRGNASRHLMWRASLISLVWSPDDTVIACGTEDCSVHFWRLATGKHSEMSGFATKPRALSWSEDSRLLATAGDRTVSVWPFDPRGPEGRKPTLLVAHQALCTVLEFHPARSWLASGGDDGNVIIWDAHAPTFPLGTGRLHETITALAWTHAGRLLVAADASGLVQTLQAPA